MKLDRIKLKEEIIKLINNSYTGKIEDMGFISFYSSNSDMEKQFRFRLQFDDMLTYEGYLVSLKKIEYYFFNLISHELKKYYDKEMSLSIGKFYKTDYDFCQEIETEYHLQEFLEEFLKCYNFYETVIFPKLTDINFLAEYVGSVPFENALEIVVGGTYPVTFFKKLAILKWGNHYRYEEYKKGLARFIEEDLLDPKYQQEAPLYKQGFEKLIYHLENEPNPFL